MIAVEPPLLTADELAALAQQVDVSAHASTPCATCGPLNCTGWESMPSTFDRRALTRVGTLCDPQIDDPTLDEYHPDGTHGWSPDAPIAVAYHPYNRCDVWQCPACRRAYLRYTEYGGYYVDERVRRVDAERVVR